MPTAARLIRDRQNAYRNFPAPDGVSTTAEDAVVVTVRVALLPGVDDVGETEQ